MTQRFRHSLALGLAFATVIALQSLLAFAVPISEDNVRDLDEIGSWPTQGVPVLALEVSQDGSRIYGTKGNLVTVWETSTGAVLNSWQADPSYAAGLDLSFDETLLATAGSDNSVNIWDAATGSHVRRLYPAGTHTVAFSPDGTQIASGGRAGILYVWDVTTGDLAHDIAVGSRMFGVGFSPDGTMIATVHGLPDFAVRLWDTATGELIWESFDHSSDAHALAFSPDGEKLATVDGDAHVYVFDVATGQRLLNLIGHQQPLFHVAFITDALLASADGGGLIRFWDVETGRGLNSLSLFREQVCALAISPDKELLVAASFDMRMALIAVPD
jgi:WD40 repeat protein